MPRVEAAEFPAVDDVVPLGEFFEEFGDFGGVVLQVGVHHEEDVAAGGAHAGGQRRRLAKVSSEANSRNAVIFSGQIANCLPTGVGGAIVDEDDFDVGDGGATRCRDLRVEFTKAVGFVEDGDDDGEHARR